ncbi:hypothetical protein BST42_05845 [Mycolicibacterium rhodesiae]|uniref:Uncharacterized protein n=1 Tax=Mycolicibacterium rhodesiae TaxID=36814 RepID=A0A1X0J2H5_MYCRH|nr:hypothetical protein BST42_05845 [Mycolicibacterium rhodesiae]
MSVMALLSVSADAASALLSDSTVRTGTGVEAPAVLLPDEGRGVRREVSVLAVFDESVPDEGESAARGLGACCRAV